MACSGGAGAPEAAQRAAPATSPEPGGIPMSRSRPASKPGSRVLPSLLAAAVLAAGASGDAAPARAADEAAPAPPKPAASEAPAPVYRLPKVGTPRGRIGGGRRGPILGDAEIQALVPDHVGQTTAAQPDLYWYLARPVQGEVAFEVTVVDERKIDPVVDRRLARPDAAGPQRIRLADLGVTLEPGQEYQWSVAVVPDPSDHAKDVVASGWIERVSAPEGLAGRLAAAGPDGAATIYG